MQDQPPRASVSKQALIPDAFLLLGSPPCLVGARGPPLPRCTMASRIGLRMELMKQQAQQEAERERMQQQMMMNYMQQQRMPVASSPAINTPVHYQSPPPVPGEVLKVTVPGTGLERGRFGGSLGDAGALTGYFHAGAVLPGEPHHLPLAEVAGQEGAGVPLRDLREQIRRPRQPRQPLAKAPSGRVPRRAARPRPLLLGGQQRAQQPHGHAQHRLQPREGGEEGAAGLLDRARGPSARPGE